MIEISHQQARRLLRQTEDGGRLPEAQWALLQAHLEGCPECRAYAERRQALARSVAHSLRERWSGAGSSAAVQRELAKRVAAARARRDRLLRIANRVVLGLGVLAAALLFLRYRSAAPPAVPTPAPPARSASATPADPDLARDTYRGLLVYSAPGEGGDAEIFLLNRRESGPDGAEITLLASHPAQDVAPVWSPDGVWIAFLSNRGEDGTVTDHYELYAVSVAGTRLTRLTDMPDVDWQGPVSWSADGYMIALTGIRRGASARPYVYLVPVGIIGPDGSTAPRALAYTTGAPGPLRFSPTTDLLAYAGPELFGGLILYNLNERTFYALAPPRNGQGKTFAPAGEAFDWMGNGYDLAYLAQGLPDVAGITGSETSLWMTEQLNLAISTRSDAPAHLLLERVTQRDGLRGVAAAPDSQRVVASLFNPGNQGCWKVTLRLDGLERAPHIIDGFCVEGDLRRENWSADGRWLVVTGRPQFAATAPGLYALRVPQDPQAPQDDFFARIGEGGELVPEPGMRVAPEWALAQPVLRPSSPYALDIQIRAAEPQPPAPAPAPLPESAPGTILYEVQRGEQRTEIWAFTPESGDHQMLATSDLTSACPALAPDGSRFAYLEDSPNTSDVPAVLVAGLDGKTQRLVTASARRDLAGGLEMSCPVWSPDGRFLAWMVFRPQESFLKILSVNDGEDALLRIATPSYLAPPVWTPDSAALLYATARSGVYSTRLLAVLRPAMAADAPGSPELSAAVGGLIAHIEATPPGVGNNIYDDVLKLAFSKDAALAFLQVGWMNEAPVDLYELTPSGDYVVLSDLPSSKVSPYQGRPVLLEYLTDGSLIFASRHEVDAVNKSVLWIYDRNEKQRRPLAFLADMLYDAALSPDERWLVYSSDAGLYALDLAAARRGPVTPALLSAEPAWEVDWK